MNTIPHNTIQPSLRETALMREGRRHRAKHKPKTLSYWLQTALGMVWLYLVIKGGVAISLLGRINENPEAMQEVVTCCLTLLLVSVCLLVLHFKTGKSQG